MKIVKLFVFILALLVIQNSLAWSYIDSRVVALLSDIRAVDSALKEACKIRCPETDEGIDFLVNNGYMKRKPADPWGAEYHYEFRNGSYRVWTYGEDGTLGGEKLNFDYASSTPEENEKNLNAIRDEIAIGQVLLWMTLFITSIGGIYIVFYSFKKLYKIFR